MTNPSPKSLWMDFWDEGTDLLGPGTFTEADTGCPICKEANYNGANIDNQIVKVKACGHAFHLPCLATWLDHAETNRRRCPVCRHILIQNYAVLNNTDTLLDSHPIFIEFLEMLPVFSALCMATAELHEVMSNMETDSRSPISGDLELRWQLAEQTEVAKVTLQHHLTGVGFAELPTLEEMLGDRPVNLATGDAKEIYQDLVGQSYEVMAWILSFESDDEKDDSENDTDDESGDEGGDEDGDDSDDNEDGDTEHYEAMENVT